MGNAESQTEDDSRFFGYRIYKIFKDGPISFTESKELEDFIIPPTEVYNNEISFIDYIKKHENTQIELTIYSIKKRCFKEILITPSQNWGDGKLGLIGASVRREDWSTAHKNLLRVLEVRENSIAEKLGIQSLDDYIIAIRPEEDDIYTLNVSANDPLSNFTYLINKFRNKKIEIVLYNSKTGTKNVNLELKTNESLGCDVGYGKLHEFIKDNETIMKMHSQDLKEIEMIEKKENEIDKIGEKKEENKEGREEGRKEELNKEKDVLIEKKIENKARIEDKENNEEDIIIQSIPNIHNY